MFRYLTILAQKRRLLEATACHILIRCRAGHDVFQGRPEEGFLVEQTEELLPDGTVVKQQVQTEETVQTVSSHDWEEAELAAAADSEHFVVEPPEESVEIEEVEETLPDGSTMRKLRKIKHVTERITEREVSDEVSENEVEEAEEPRQYPITATDGSVGRFDRFILWGDGGGGGSDLSRVTDARISPVVCVRLFRFCVFTLPVPSSGPCPGNRVGYRFGSHASLRDACCMDNRELTEEVSKQTLADREEEAPGLKAEGVENKEPKTTSKIDEQVINVAKETTQQTAYAAEHERMDENEETETAATLQKIGEIKVPETVENEATEEEIDGGAKEINKEQQKETKPEVEGVRLEEEEEKEAEV
ncbi:unnamed protein product, partial [Dibothriocephalus latus]